MLKNEMAMQRLLVIVVAILSFGWPMLSHAVQSGDSMQVRLPRSFEGARLGMTRQQLSTAAPEVLAASAKGARPSSQNVMVSAKRNAYVDRVEYRFFQTSLKDMVIHYKYDRVPRGYDGLLDKLKTSYGKPAAQNVVEYDPQADVFFTKKTVWKDDATIIVLSEGRKMRQGKEVPELAITMTDLALQETSQRFEEEQRRKREFAVPVPIDDAAQPRSG